MILRKFLLTLSALGALSLTVFAQTTGTTTTTTTATRQTTFSPVGLGSSETLEVNVANLAANPTSGTAASCTGSVSFVNASGAAIGTASNFTLTSGQMKAVTLPYTSSGTSSGRALVRAVISVTLTSGTPCQLASSLATYDTSTGATHAYVDGGEMAGGYGFGPGR